MDPADGAEYLAQIASDAALKAQRRSAAKGKEAPSSEGLIEYHNSNLESL